MDASRYADACGLASNRWDDAIGIQGGACNPSGIARALVRAINACHEENVNAREDAAVRLICHQLAFILKVAEIDNGFDTYSVLTRECETKSAAVKLAKV